MSRFVDTYSTVIEDILKTMVTPCISSQTSASNNKDNGALAPRHAGFSTNTLHRDIFLVISKAKHLLRHDPSWYQLEKNAIWTGSGASVRYKTGDGS